MRDFLKVMSHPGKASNDLYIYVYETIKTVQQERSMVILAG